MTRQVLAREANLYRSQIMIKTLRQADCKADCKAGCKAHNKQPINELCTCRKVEAV